MKVKFYWVLEKDSELEYIQTDLIMKDNGKSHIEMDLEYKNLYVVMLTLVNKYEIKKMGREN